MSRRVMLVTHPTREDVPELARQFGERLADHGIEVEVVPEVPPTRRIELSGQGDDSTDAALLTKSPLPPDIDATGCELVVVFGGDGTILRGAEVARPANVPLLGVNMGRVGFLAEAERDDVGSIVTRIAERDYHVERRMTLEVDVLHEGAVVAHNWALNEASVEKAARERMLEVVVEVDGRPLSRWGCDGVVCATPTGSTAYNFSAGGPVVWPDVEALLMVPISAHALFARPMVVSPDSVLAIELLAPVEGAGVLWCDGRRSVDLPQGARIEVRRGARQVRLARLHEAPFTGRLVAKFDLPVTGWRGAAERRRRQEETGAPDA